MRRFGARTFRLPRPRRVALKDAVASRALCSALRTPRQYARCRFRSALGSSAIVWIRHCLLASSKSILTGYCLLGERCNFIVNVNLGIYDFVTTSMMSLKVSHIRRLFRIKP